MRMSVRCALVQAPPLSSRVTAMDETDAVSRSLSAPVLGSTRSPVTGRVKWFNAQRGFGYIVHAASGEDVFVRRSAISKRNPLKRYPSLDGGEEVDFVMRRGEKGWEASYVTGPRGACVKGSKYTPTTDGKGRKKLRRRATVTSATTGGVTTSLEALLPELQLQSPSSYSGESECVLGSPPGGKAVRLISRIEEEIPSSGELEPSSQPTSLSISGDDVFSTTTTASEQNTEQHPGDHKEGACSPQLPSPLSSLSPSSRGPLPTRHHSLDTILESTSEMTSELGSEVMAKEGWGGHVRSLHGSLKMKKKKQPPRLTRELNCTEVSCLLSTNRFARRVLSTPNVVSMSYTHETRDGEKTGRKVLQVGVVKKLKKHQLKRPNIRLPKEVLLGKDLAVPVQVVEEGELRLFGRYSGGAQLKVSHDKAVYGTLGARVKEKNSHRLLSCAHVLTLFKEENIGTPIAVAHSREDNEYLDLGWRVGGQAKVKRSLWSKKLIIRQDIAWADVKRSQVSDNIIKIGKVSRRRRPEVGRKVKIYGGYSGIFVEGATIANTDAMTMCNSGMIEFKHLCYIEGDLGFIDGDSGSAVVDEDTNELVGIFMGASNIKTYFSAVVQ